MSKRSAPTLAEVFGLTRQKEALAAIATPVEERGPRQQALAREYLQAMIDHVVENLRSPDAQRPRPSNAWVR